jgi:hypothetical protein
LCFKPIVFFLNLGTADFYQFFRAPPPPLSFTDTFIHSDSIGSHQFRYSFLHLLEFKIYKTRVHFYVDL